ncbi:DnaD domain protein [Enterococcus faecalis]|uniref:DnaD domain protein n=1 Tax=Enterococcus faecalis TaxID=1351 RepID=UPI001D0B2072|nr:DnaD domain protein [Enterococcus faecalis]UDM42915.1 DnaD domain protein [Enterococcus faecalis]BDQ55149.1 GntR family transcriptional regulator [Enterococcus faecalis]
MAIGGWIKLYRTIQDHWIWENPQYLKWWLDLILMANHQDRKILFDGELKTVKVGERITSEKKLSERWEVSRNTVRKFLDLLVKDDMIELSRSRQNGTWYKVSNYAEYQSFSEIKKQRSEQQAAHQTEQRTEHKQEPKEPKNLRNNNNNKGAFIRSIWENNGFGPMSSKTMTDFDYWISDFEKIGASQKDAEQLIIKAIEIAIDANARNYNYINAILIDWERRGFKSVEEREAARKQKKTTKQQKSNTGHSDYDDLGF